VTKRLVLIIIILNELNLVCVFVPPIGVIVLSASANMLVCVQLLCPGFQPSGGLTERKHSGQSVIPYALVQWSSQCTSHTIAGLRIGQPTTQNTLVMNNTEIYTVMTLSQHKWDGKSWYTVIMP